MDDMIYTNFCIFHSAVRYSLSVKNRNKEEWKDSNQYRM